MARVRRLLSSRTGALLLAGAVLLLAGGAGVIALSSGSDSDGGEADRGPRDGREIDPAQEGVRLLEHRAVGLRGPACVRLPERGRASVRYEISNATMARRTYQVSATATGLRLSRVPRRIALGRRETRRFTVLAATRSGDAPVADAFIELNAVNIGDRGDARTASTEVESADASNC